MRYLAIDYGNKRTGLAICDKSEKIVSPFAVIQSNKDLIGKIQQIVEQQNVGALVVGLPLNMDDSQGKQAKIVCKFSDELKSKLKIPIYLQDERLSTFSAQEKLKELSFQKSQKKKLLHKEKRMLDALAAAEILQTFLDTIKNQNL